MKKTPYTKKNVDLSFAKRIITAHFSMYSVEAQIHTDDAREPLPVTFNLYIFDRKGDKSISLFSLMDSETSCIGELGYYLFTDRGIDVDPPYEDATAAAFEDFYFPTLPEGGVPEYLKEHSDAFASVTDATLDFVRDHSATRPIVLGYAGLSQTAQNVLNYGSPEEIATDEGLREVFKAAGYKVEVCEMRNSEEKDLFYVAYREFKI